MKHVSALFLTLLAASTLNAQDNKFGFQATVSRPAGDVGDSDLMDGRLGYGLGLHGLIVLGGGVAIVPRIDYIAYKRDWTRNAVINEDEKVNILSGGADFHYYFGGEANQGFYVLGGVGYASGKFESTYSSNGLVLSASATKGAIYLQGGAGVQFNPNIGVECSYQTLTFSDVETTYLGYTSRRDVSSPSLRASLVLHF